MLLNFKKRRRLALALICLFWLIPALLLIGLKILDTEALPDLVYRVYTYVRMTFDQGEFGIRDSLAWHGKKAPLDEELVYLAVDNRSLVLDHLWEEDFEESEALRLMKSSWPWPRTVYGHILDRLFEAGAKVVMLDFLFFTPTENDQYLKESLDKYREKVVVGANYTFVEAPFGGLIRKLDIPYGTVIPQTDPLDKRIAYVNVPLDKDNETVRGIDYYKREGTKALTARALQIIGEDHLIKEVTERKILRYGAIVGEGYLPHTVADIFVESIWQNNYQNGAFFKDKVVILGPFGNWTQDYHMTPVGNMPGPEIHLNALAAARHGYFISETSLWGECLAITLASLIAWFLSVSLKQPFIRVLCMVVMNGAFVALLFYLYNEHSFFLTAFLPLLVFNTGGFSCLVLEYVSDWVEKNRVRSTFESYVSKNLVKQILDSPDEYMDSLGGVRKPVTVFFSDVRNFTTMTEAADSQQLVNQLNEYFTAMVDCVFNHGGTLDKFIGDAIMAVWGNTTSEGVKEDVTNGVRASLAMLPELDRLNADWESRGIAPLSIGMGLNCGEVIVGNMGSLKKKEFTVIGDAVNLASRLEGVTKQYGISFCVGENIVDLIRDDFIIQTVDLIQVKGKTKPVEVFTIHAEKSLVDEKAYTWLEPYEKGINFYRNLAFIEAEECFGYAYALAPEDNLTSLYIKRCQDYQESPPPEDWDGVYVMKGK